ncbi:MAG: hypothetical protein ACK55Z_22000, partial [bacterium]
MARRLLLRANSVHAFNDLALADRVHFATTRCNTTLRRRAARHVTRALAAERSSQRRRILLN